MVLWYTTTFSILGLAIVLFAFTHLPSDVAGLVVFSALAATAELLRVELFSTSRFSSVSLSEIFATASIAVVSPLAGVIVLLFSGITTAFTTSISHDNPKAERASWFRRAAFNVGMYVIGSAAAGFVYVATGGQTENIRLASNILPLLFAVVTSLGMNILILLGVIVLQTGRHPRQVWQQDLRWSIPITVVASFLGGGALAIAYALLGVLGVLFFAFPVLATTYSFRLYKTNMKEVLEKLEDTNCILDEANLDLLETLGAVVDAYDSYTYGHSTQVAVYAEALAAQLGLAPAERAMIVKAAMVHDIGKVGVMDSIIGKQGPLTDEEFAVLKRHPVIGAEIVGRMQGLQDIVPSVRGHHERWDGKGYPDGLIGTAIPRGARILAVADAVDAMCSDRPYRPLRNFREVVEEVTRCSGQHFDPETVQAFIAIVEEKGPDFFKNSAAMVDRSILLTGTGTANLTARYLKKSMVAGIRQP